ncbi:MAG: hypothetical protein LC104_10000 [Bacteroidales bacterium]|nr:hypothetical protein [Bacteroidales bacterium]
MALISTQTVTELATHLNNGRRLVLESDGTADYLRVLSPDGQIEIDMMITADGPIVRVRAARLEIAATEEMSLRSQQLTLDASAGIALRSAGPVRITGEELRVRTEQSIHLNGATVRLNCTDSDTPPEEHASVTLTPPETVSVAPSCSCPGKHPPQ